MANFTSLLKKEGRRANLSKIIRSAIIINVCQIIAISALTLYALALDDLHLSGWVARTFTVIAALIVIWGAALDIREARTAARSARQRREIEATYAHLEELNATLRAQRHDFMNHIQIIYTLTELDDRASALEYMERVYSDIQKVGRALKTASPAVNALIAAKLADCEENGVELATDIRTDWKECPVPGWEMCRILGNLIDNAVEAMDGAAERRVCVRLWEDVRAWHFSVENSGVRVPDSVSQSIFQPGFSTKGEGRGMGLYIVRRIMDEYGGAIELVMAEETTCFRGSIPRKLTAAIN